MLCKQNIIKILSFMIVLTLQSSYVCAEDMSQMWGESKAISSSESRIKFFEDGNYAMFIHWGLYSYLGNKVDGKTYYGISEWIMNEKMANIPVEKYKDFAKEFNPEKFNASEIVQLAKDAGMKYIVITAKHHDGFAMYHSKADSFNIYDATPFKRDPLKELSEACKEAGIGLGFYYSHNQDWTFPGGANGPTTDESGKEFVFDDYFTLKCLPQVKELITEYGPISLIWFDTPGNISKNYVEQLVKTVRHYQPQAVISGRIGHGLGDYQTLGDMELPNRNIQGHWESVDTINDSWGYAWYDQNWKTPKNIVENLITCVARGGTYMLNVGLCGDGSIPDRASNSLKEAGKWIRRHPQVIYGVQPSPWGHTLPWGDVTAEGNTLYLSVFNWPVDGYLYVPGLKSEIRQAVLLSDKEKKLRYERVNNWIKIKIPDNAPDNYVSVIKIRLKSSPLVDSCLGVDPIMKTVIPAEFADVENVTRESKRWMEKFGEWKHVVHITNWSQDSDATWDINVLCPGDYQVSLTYSGVGRLVWQVSVEDGETIRNQQGSYSGYHCFEIGNLNFPKPGFYKVSVSCLEGDMSQASLKSIGLTPIR